MDGARKQKRCKAGASGGFDRRCSDCDVPASCQFLWPAPRGPAPGGSLSAAGAESASIYASTVTAAGERGQARAAVSEPGSAVSEPDTAISKSDTTSVPTLSRTGRCTTAAAGAKSVWSADGRSRRLPEFELQRADQSAARLSRNCAAALCTAGASWRVAEYASQCSGAATAADAAQRPEFSPASTRGTAAGDEPAEPGEPDARRPARANLGACRKSGAVVAGRTSAGGTVGTPVDGDAPGPSGDDAECISRSEIGSSGSALDCAELEPVPEPVQSAGAGHSVEYVAG